MAFADKILMWCEFALICAVVVLAPWLFGAWEMWWFWLFVLLIFASFALFGLRVVSYLWHDGAGGPDADSESVRIGPSGGTRRDVRLVLSFLPFLGYALVRFLQADVFMDAERSFLLFLTPLLVALQIIFGLDRARRKMLWTVILANLCVLAVYGVANHLFGDTRFWFLGGHRALWVQGYETYVAENRATGSYFCPDHFSGVMEIAYGLALAVLLTRGLGVLRKSLAGALCVLALWGVAVSKSRGGGLTVVVVTLAALMWGFLQWQQPQRRYLRLGGAVLLAASLSLFCLWGKSYTERFMGHFWDDGMGSKSAKQAFSLIVQKQKDSMRGQMVEGALRAWKDRPILGIGPGMHQNLWPHYAASEDGDRKLGTWPKFLNNNFHSYEVHSDWVQLLEEYGIVGFVLFLIPAALCLFAFLRGLYGQAENTGFMSDRNYAMILGGLLACVAMAFHSLGDFNLQIPATSWLLGAIIGLALSCV